MNRIVHYGFVGAVLLGLTAGSAWAQSGFFRQVVLKPLASQADGLRVVGILLGSKKGDLVSDTRLLRHRDVLPENWRPSSAEPLSKGYASYLLVTAMGIDGGGNQRLFGWNKRRAFQELVYLQVMPGKGGPHAKLTGPEMITVLDRSSDLLRKERASRDND